MCGIAGQFVYRNGAPGVQKEELLRIRDSMIARGPDGEGLWISQNKKIGLAHRRLSIIDLSPTGAQPMKTKSGLIHIVFNGEIYNYRDLRKWLEGKGYHFHSNSDTEVLLHLYEEKGQEMVHDLRGMYAFGLWDERKQGLFLCRDPFGIKPLYYSDDGASIRFASQVKALLAGGNINTSADPAGHVGFFLFGHLPDPHTLYKEIRALPAGSSIWIGKNSVGQPKSFFNIGEEFSKAKEKSQSAIKPEEALVSLRSSLVDSVRHHMIADVPVGIFLSSGLDSSTLVALASEVVGDKLRTVTLKFNEFEGTGNDESPLAEVVAEHYKTKHHTRQISAKDFKSNLDNIINSMDQPTIDGINTFFVSKVTAESGLKVCLSGVGGDEIFGGYSTFNQIPRLVNFTRMIPGVKNFGEIFRGLSVSLIKKFTSPKYAGIFEYGSSYGGAYLIGRGLFMPWELPEFLDGDLVRQGWRELQPVIRLEKTIENINSDHQKISALELSWYMRNQLLRDTDWASMAHSLEIRIPFIDIDVFRCLLSLSAKNFYPTKINMAKTPSKAIPKELLTRPKTGFFIPAYDWFLKECDPGNNENGARGWAKALYKLASKN
jgi:asparagine synthase (glutamine-hydrolysing)